MNDEVRMGKSKNNKTAIEWAGITYNPMLPHQIKKFIDSRSGPRGPKKVLGEHVVHIEPGQGTLVGPFDDDNLAKEAAKSMQNYMAKLKWPEGYNIGLYPEEGLLWVAVVRGLKARPPGTRGVIIME